MRVASSFVSLGVLVLLGMGGCGGESFNSGDDDDAGSSGNGSGATGSGGKGNPGSSGSGQAGSNRAGSPSVGSGGRPGGIGGGPSVSGTGSSASGTGGSGMPMGGMAGSAPVGGTAGSAGEPAGGAGGEPAELCQLPAVPGDCDGFFERWYFNAERGICEVFYYGGCGGNDNNFDTLEACSDACAGQGKTDPTACLTPTECVVTAARCCGTSEVPTLADVTAVNAKNLEEFTAPCALVDCASPFGPLPAHFGATCRDGHCLAFDVRGTEITRCEDSSECSLRDGLSCCEGCGVDYQGFVAVRNQSDALYELICGDGPTECLACEPVPPPDIAAQCVEEECTIVLLPAGG